MRRPARAAAAYVLGLLVVCSSAGGDGLDARRRGEAAERAAAARAVHEQARVALDEAGLRIAAVALLEVHSSQRGHHRHHRHASRLRDGQAHLGRSLMPPISLDVGTGDLRRVVVSAAGGEQRGHTRPLAPGDPTSPTKPAKPFADMIIKLIMTILMLVIGIVEPIITPLMMLLFEYLMPLIIMMVAFPLIATMGPLLLNLCQKNELINSIVQYLIVPFWNLYVGVMQPPGYGMPYMSMAGPPYGSSFGQVAQENIRCYTMLEEYIKRCAAPPNTLPTSFIEIATATTAPATTKTAASAAPAPAPAPAIAEAAAAAAGAAASPASSPPTRGMPARAAGSHSDGTATPAALVRVPPPSIEDVASAFLELQSTTTAAPTTPGFDLRHNIYAGMAGGDFFHPPIKPGYNSFDPYDPYGPDGPEGDPAPNNAFKRCRQVLDSWLNTCGTPTA